MPHTDDHQRVTLAEIAASHDIQSRRCFIVNRSQVEDGAKATVHREDYHHGAVQHISPDEVEGALRDAITTFKAQCNADLVLVGFAIHFELQMLATIYPRWTEYFTS
jgi:hypothetical protein